MEIYCENSFCIYCSDYYCSLDSVHIGEFGLCAQIINVVIEEDLLAVKRKELLEKFEQLKK